MARDIPISNGSVLVAFNKDYLLSEFYYPHVGEENHIGGYPFRFGIWCNGKFSWLPDGWEIAIDYVDDTLVTYVRLVNKGLKIRIIANDLVDFHENIYIKKLTVENVSNEPQEIRLFMCHNFFIYGNNVGNTAAFKPEVNGILHYKSERYFLINVCTSNKYGVDQFAVGQSEQGLTEGTWKDAEDGILSGNPIAQGSVDSVVAVHVQLEPGNKDTFYYWICAGKNWNDVYTLNNIIKDKTPEEILNRTTDYWKLWSDKEELNYALLTSKIAQLYRRSLLIIRTQIDDDGAIIAANDSDNMQFNKDTYSYVWPRDGALVSYALDLAGYSEVTRNFFNFCAKVIRRDGYFMHKYTPSGMLGSSWHPWLKDNKLQLPIQEDETALVIWALWNHYKNYKDIEFIKPLYRPLIKNAANFMLDYRDKVTKLPLPSYDLWEERQGIFTFTAGAVYGGLIAASNFAESFGQTDISEKYSEGAMEIREAMDKYLYLQKEQRFARMINIREDGKIDIDPTIDASLYGIFAFGAYEADDEKVVSTMNQVYEKLWCKTFVGGLARYENDNYHRASDNVPGNPWFVTTMWLGQYYIAKAKTKAELDKSIEIMEWVASHALQSGVMAEQVDPYTKEPISVSPLTWSHATFVTLVQEYINKLLKTEICPACNHPKRFKKRYLDLKLS